MGRLAQALSIIKPILVVVLLITIAIPFAWSYQRVIPLKITLPQDTIIPDLERKLIQRGVFPKKAKGLSVDIYNVCAMRGISPYLIIALMETESNYDLKAISSAGYKSLMQTPSSSGYADVDTLHGIRILQDKLGIVNGKLDQGLLQYGGFRDFPERGKPYVLKVLRLYAVLQE